MQLAGINIYLDYVSRYSKTRRIKKRLFKNFIALDVYCRPIISLGIIVNAIKVIDWKKRSFEYYNIIQKNEMIIAFINNIVLDRILISLISDLGEEKWRLIDQN